jgi:hypothetical protein
MGTQECLEALYEGSEFEGQKSLARMGATVIVIIVYSSGMPILYLIGALFFTLTYMKEKFLIIKYHKRTDTSLSKDLPLYTLSLLRLTIIAKMLMGIAMFTDPQIFETITPPSDGSIPFKIDVKQLLLNLQNTGEENNNEINGKEIDYIARV